MKRSVTFGDVELWRPTIIEVGNISVAEAVELATKRIIASAGTYTPIRHAKQEASAFVQAYEFHLRKSEESRARQLKMYNDAYEEALLDAGWPIPTEDE